MPDFSDPFEPYASPIEAQVAEPARPTPTGLKVICIIAMILGGLGTLVALVSGVGIVFGHAAQAALAPQQPEFEPELEDVQQKLQTEVEAIAGKYVIPNAILAIGHLFTAVLLLSGSIMTLQLKRPGPGILTFGCATAILYLVAYGTLNMAVQLESLPIYRTFANDFMAEAGRQAGAQGAEAMAQMPNFMMAAIFVGMVFTVLLSLVKIVFYLVSIFYLRKQPVRALFSSEDTVVERM